MEGQEHFYMETQTILAVPRAEDKEMVLHLGTQFPTHVQVTAWERGQGWVLHLHPRVGGAAFKGTWDNINTHVWARSLSCKDRVCCSASGRAHVVSWLWAPW